MADWEVIRPRRPTGLRRMLESVRSIWLGPYNTKDRELARLFGGTAGSSGVAVNEESSLTYAAVWNAVNLIASDIAKIPLAFYRRVGESGKEVWRDHPLYELLHDQPNPEMSSFQFRRLLQGHALLWGNGYAEIERNGSGAPTALWPLMPWSVTAMRGGRLFYRVRQPSGRDVDFDRMEILHFSGLGQDGVTGFPPIRKAMESLGLGMATERFGATFFGNGATFGGVIKYPVGAASSLQARKDAREAIEKRHQGVDRAHRLMSLYDGGEYQQLGVPPEAAQFLETRRFQIEEVSRWFNIPVHKLKELQRTSYNSIEHLSIEYATDTLQPWFRMWEGELRLKLIPRLERKLQFFEHMTEALTRGDSAAQGELMSKQFSVGAISPNEIRQKFNMNPLPDGDAIYVPSNMMPAGIATKYWEAQIEETQAKAIAAKRPPPEPAAPVKAENKKLQRELDLSRLQRQEALDAADVAKAGQATVLSDLAREIQVREELDKARQQAIDQLDRALTELSGVRTELITATDVLAIRTLERDDARIGVEAGLRTLGVAQARIEVVEGERDAARTGLAEATRSLKDVMVERDGLEPRLVAAEKISETAQTQRALFVTSLRSLLVDAFERILQFEIVRARKAQATPEKLRTWVSTYYPNHGESVRATLRPVVEAWAIVTEDDAERLLEHLVTMHLAASSEALRQVADVEDPDEMAAALERTLRRWETERPAAVVDRLIREGLHG